MNLFAISECHLSVIWVSLAECPISEIQCRDDWIRLIGKKGDHVIHEMKRLMVHYMIHRLVCDTEDDWWLLVRSICRRLPLATNSSSSSSSSSSSCQASFNATIYISVGAARRRSLVSRRSLTLPPTVHPPSAAAAPRGGRRYFSHFAHSAKNITVPYSITSYSIHFSQVTSSLIRKKPILALNWMLTFINYYFDNSEKWTLLIGLIYILFQ